MYQSSCIMNAIYTSGVLHSPLYPRRFSDFKSVDRIVMNRSASCALGDSNRMRLRDVATLHHDQREFPVGRAAYTHSYMSIWAFVATQSSTWDPFRLATALAS